MPIAKNTTGFASFRLTGALNRVCSSALLMHQSAVQSIYCGIVLVGGRKDECVKLHFGRCAAFHGNR